MSLFARTIESIKEVDIIEVLSNTDGAFKLPASNQVNYSIVRCRMRGNNNNIVILCSRDSYNSFIIASTKQQCRRNNIFFEGVYSCPVGVISAINNKKKVSEIKKSYSSTEQQISNIIDKAINKGASDVHVQLIKTSNSAHISFRIKGLLYFQDGMTFEEGQRILNALFQKSTGKNGAELNFEKTTSLPVVWDDDVNKSLRVECAPNALYFKSIWRLFGSINTANVSYKSLGYDEPSCELLDRLVFLSTGAVLVTGPVGSGKTTTMYAHLNNIRRTHGDKHGHPSCNIASIEDPVEQVIEGADQRQIDASVEDKAIATKEAVASLLRSDPNIVFMGEVRYQVQAEVLLDISVIGSMAYGTMHADTHVGAVRRLRNKFGFDPDYFDVSGSLTAIVSQRLVPKLCQKCCLDKVRYAAKYPKLFSFSQFYLSKYVHDFSMLKFANKDSDCQYCNGEGYSSRVLVYEIYNPNINLKKVGGHYMKGEYTQGYQAFMEADNSNGVDGVTLGERCLQKVLKGEVCAFDGANLIAAYPVPKRCEINAKKLGVVNE